MKRTTRMYMEPGQPGRFFAAEKILRNSFTRQTGVFLQVVILVFLLAGFSSCASGAAAEDLFSVDDIAVRELAKIDLENQKDRLLIFIHGAGDSPADWSQDLADRAGGVALNWEAAAADRMQAPARGYEIGFAMGKVLAEKYRTAGSDTQPDERSDTQSGSRAGRQPEGFFLMAHSAGAWLAQGITDGLQQSAQQKANKRAAVELVFLDPFTAKSIFQPFSGGRLLGIGADAVRTYYTKTDPIPFTAGKVAVGERIDVTDLLYSTDSSSTEDRTLAHWQVIDYAAGIEFPSSAP
jgi:hypothetical protein